jgi:hypothetical protein
MTGFGADKLAVSFFDFRQLPRFPHDAKESPLETERLN